MEKPLKAELMQLAEEAGMEVSHLLDSHYTFYHPLIHGTTVDIRSIVGAYRAKALCLGLIAMREAGELDDDNLNP